ncbi:MAG: glycosyltransferase, partial [Rhodospirillaceae bacterium]
AEWSKIPGVVFQGHVEDVRPCLESAHALLHPALGGEGLPKAVLEAGACGKAIIASDIGGNRELVVHKSTGILVRPGTPDELATAMQWLMTHPAERRAYGEAARSKVVSEFTMERILEQHVRLYREMMG